MLLRLPGLGALLNDHVARKTFGCLLWCACCTFSRLRITSVTHFMAQLMQCSVYEVALEASPDPECCSMESDGHVSICSCSTSSSWLALVACLLLIWFRVLPLSIKILHDIKSNYWGTTCCLSSWSGRVPSIKQCHLWSPRGLSENMALCPAFGKGEWSHLNWMAVFFLLFLSSCYILLFFIPLPTLVFNIFMCESPRDIGRQAAYKFK